MPDILTPKEASESYGFSNASLRRWSDEGKLPVFKTPGGQRRYNRADLEKLTKAAVPADFTNPKGRDTFGELGTNGLSRWGGTVYTESQRELQGASGRGLFREMRLNDPVIAAVFFALIHSLRKAQERIVPASEKPADKEAAEFVESCLSDMSFTWADTMTFILDPTFEQGVSLLELVYKRRLGERPGKYTNNPSTSQFNDGKIGWRKWSPRPVESLSPGNEWIFDENGGLQGINQVDANTSKNYSIPIEKLLHFRTSVYPANTPEPPPIHRAAYLPYWYTTNLQEIEGIGIERNLNGMPVLYLGADCTMDAGTESDLTKGKNLVTNIRNDEQMGVVLTRAKMGSGATEGNGMLLELLSAGQTANDISPVIERYDKRKAIIILAQFIMLGMDQVGSYALSRSQNDMFILAATSWLNSFADIINRHAIPRLMKLNAFPGITGMPKLVFSPLGIPDLAGISDYVNKLVDKAVLTPDEELERHLRQMADLPQRVEPTEVASVKPQVEKAEEVEKMNPHHDERGRFAGAPGGGSGGGEGNSTGGGGPEAAPTSSRQGKPTASAGAAAGGRSEQERLEKLMRGKLNVKDADSPRVQDQLADLGKLPPSLLTKMSTEDVRVNIGDRPITQLNGHQNLAGVQPRGWPPGKTWDDVGGLFDGITGNVTVGGKAKGGSISTILHEYGHAVYQNVVSSSQKSRVQVIHASRFSKLAKYFQQGGPGGSAGVSEMWAEGFAAVHKNRSAALKTYGKEFVEIVDAVSK